MTFQVSAYTLLLLSHYTFSVLLKPFHLPIIFNHLYSRFTSVTFRFSSSRVGNGGNSFSLQKVNTAWVTDSMSGCTITLLPTVCCEIRYTELNEAIVSSHFTPSLNQDQQFQ